MIVIIAFFRSAHILSSWGFTMLKRRINDIHVYLKHDTKYIKIYLQFTKNKRGNKDSYGTYFAI